MNKGQARLAREMRDQCFAELQAVISPDYLPSREVQLLVEVLCRAIVESTVPPYTVREGETDEEVTA